MKRVESKKTIIENETQKTKTKLVPSPTVRMMRSKQLVARPNVVVAPTTLDSGERDITFKDLCLADKKRLRDLCLQIGKVEKERKEAIEKVEELTKQNEQLLKTKHKAKVKISQSAVMLKTYQTKLEQFIAENAELKRQNEEEKVNLKVMCTTILFVDQQSDKRSNRPKLKC